MNNRELFEVTRTDYKAFVERILPGAGVVSTNEDETIVSITSARTGTLWCEREKINEESPEKYYIFDYPEQDEWGPPIPKARITLETKEEVQAFFDALAKMRKEKND